MTINEAMLETLINQAWEQGWTFSDDIDWSDLDWKESSSVESTFQFQEECESFPNQSLNRFIVSGLLFVGLIGVWLVNPPASSAKRPGERYPSASPGISQLAESAPRNRGVPAVSAVHVTRIQELRNIENQIQELAAQTGNNEPSLATVLAGKNILNRLRELLGQTESDFRRLEATENRIQENDNLIEEVKILILDLSNEIEKIENQIEEHPESTTRVAGTKRQRPN
jgi:hypothetical protein